MQMQEPLVSIICTTYNHGPFIRQCLDGFMMQKTNFTFEVLIHDDASTDNTAEIIREYEDKYPDIIKPIYQTENQYQKGIKIGITYLYPRAKGKYIAECEGDDYWTDPLKLQKQVKILETDDTYGCVYTRYKTVNEYGEDCEYPPSEYHQYRSFTGDIFSALYYGNFPQTLTILFRKELLSKLPNHPIWCDYTLFLKLSMQKKFFFLNDITGAYRINPLGLIQSGAFCNYDINSVLLFYYKIYLNEREYKRTLIPHLKIHKVFLIKFCTFQNYKEYKQYFIDIAKSSIFLALIMPFFLIKNSVGVK